MSNLETIKRLYRDYTKKFRYKILLSIFFSLIVSFFYTVDQRAINAALILSKEINYSDVQNVLNMSAVMSPFLSMTYREN